MRLLFVSQDFPPDLGGIQAFSLELAKHISPHCNHFAVIAPSRPGAAQIDRSFAFPVYRFTARPDLLALVALPFLPFFAYKHRFDLAFHAQWQTAIASLTARALTGYPKRVVVAGHGREFLFNPFSRSPLRGAYTQYRRWALSQADAFLAVSHYTAGLLTSLGVPSSRITVTYLGTDPERFYPRDASLLRCRLGVDDKRIILTVGRLVNVKAWTRPSPHCPLLRPNPRSDLSYCRNRPRPFSPGGLSAAVRRRRPGLFFRQGAG